MNGGALLNLQFMAPEITKIDQCKAVTMMTDGKCSLGRQQRPLESFNLTQHLPYVNLRNADQEDLRGVIWVYQDCLVLFGTFPSSKL